MILSRQMPADQSPYLFLRALLSEGIETADGKLDYPVIAEGIRRLSGARFAVFNEVVAQGSRTVTRAIVGGPALVEKAASLLGRTLVNASYAIDPIILEAMEAGEFREFDSAAVLSRAQFSPRTVKTVSQLLDLGPFVVRGLKLSGTPIANLILILAPGGTVKNREACELYGDLLEKLLSEHYDSEASTLAEYVARRANSATLPAEAILSAANKLPELVYELDGTGNILFINQRIEEYGYKRQELIGKSVFEIVHPEDRERAQWHVNERRTGDRRTRNFEVRILGRDRRTIFLAGQELPLADVATLELEAEGLYEDVEGERSFRGTLGIARDISERKLLESELAERLSIFRELANHVGAAIWLEERESGRLLYRNPAAAKLFGPLPADGGESRDWIFSRLDPETAEETRGRIESADPLLTQGIECKVTDATGAERWLLCRYFPVPSTGTTKAKRVVIALDRTEERVREEELLRQVSQEQAYAREMSHRVKNNLAMIHSMINLEKSSEHSRGVEEMLERIQGRIRAVGFVHELLYSNSRRRSVEITGYLRQLATGVVSGTASGTDIELLFSFPEELWVDVDRAVPLGMIATELVTNALKHAFPRGGSGRVRLSLEAEENEAVLVVADNGDGFPEGFDSEKPHSIGHDLVVALTEQIGGTFDSERVENETLFSLHFSLR